MGVGEATADSKKPTVAAADLAAIAGQKPVITRARNSIAGFKVRENMSVRGHCATVEITKRSSSARQDDFHW